MEGSIDQLAGSARAFVDLAGANPLLRFALILAASVVAAYLAEWIFTRVLIVWARRTRSDLDDRFIKLVHRPVFLSVIFLGLGLGSRELGLPPLAARVTTATLTTLAIVVWTGFAIRLSSLLLEAMSRVQDRVSIIQPRTLLIFEKVSLVALVGAALYFVFLVWGIDVGGLLMSAGVIGIAVGFAAKDTLANLFSGLFILADAPYKLGDFVVLDSGERGKVTQIGLRSTRLQTRDDVEITLPNAVIANAKIINESGGPWEKERLRVPLGVAYGTDVDRVREILLEVAAEQDHVVADPEPRVRFRRFGDSALEFELLCWIDEPVLRGRAQDALNTAIYKRFAQSGIEIPYPKRDIYLHRVEPPREP